MALGHSGKVYEQDVLHVITLHYNNNDVGTPFYSEQHVPPSRVVAVWNHKITDFTSGTTCTMDIGFDYLDGTSDVGDAIVDGANLLAAGGAQSSVALTLEDAATACVTNTAARIKVTIAETGTASTAGEGYVHVAYIPLNRESARSPAYA